MGFIVSPPQMNKVATSHYLIAMIRSSFNAVDEFEAVSLLKAAGLSLLIEHFVELPLVSAWEKLLLLTTRWLETSAKHSRCVLKHENYQESFLLFKCFCFVLINCNLIR